MFRFLVRLFYLPLFLIGGNGLALFIVEAGYSKLWLAALVLTFIALAFLLERAVPFDTAFNKPHGDRARDFYHALFNEASSVIGVALVPVLAGLVTIPSIWPTELPLVLQLLMAIFIADIGITLVHYASHRIDALWRLHAVHHSIKRMYGFNGLMKHPLHQLLETLGGTAPLLLMGIPQEVLLLFVVAVLLQLLLQHSNVAYFVGPLKRVLVVNVLHRFHHLKTGEEGDVNFGLFTTFTDYLLGTAYYDENRVISSGDLGIAAQPNYPTSYLRQLVQPFKPQEKVEYAARKPAE
ncbi:sterol desaturase family protein [Kordiimonas aquimaris]|uniref:sterol desaturase family protein n=1 Tax=Kordiimonas aquimaris TaxID=707591 RepID=UPI0021D19575|nr:sterol desaturase family protein [Kordiimonas aquimaris]